jgi:hypothetical protein
VSVRKRLHCAVREKIDGCRLRLLA